MLSPQKLEQKQLQLIARTTQALALASDAEARQLLQTPRQQSFRINRLLVHDATKLLAELAALGWEGKPIDWCPDGYTISAGFTKLRDSEQAKSGQIYIQNAASWLPVIALDPQPGEQILDVCAAPGGKTSHIAQLADNQAHITANDNSRARLAKLQANTRRLGVQNIDYTLYDATRLTYKLPNAKFDKVLLDAPCSGEGMMLLDNPKDFESWSVAHIKRLQKLQKQLIAQAWKLVKPGGVLVYSTCTMAPEENEAVIDYLLRHQPDAHILPFETPTLSNRRPSILSWNDKLYTPQISDTVRLQSSGAIEAFFVCVLSKRATTEDTDYYRL